MSKTTIPTLPAGGNQRLINTEGSRPVGGLNLPRAAQPGWNSHDPAAACGQAAGVPANVNVEAPKGEIPGQPLPFPARSAPATLEVAGRSGAPAREGN